jgi:hypothetical protein
MEKVIGKHGNEPFSLMRIYSHLVDISFPSVCGVHPSLALKGTVLHNCNNQDSALLDMSNISHGVVAFC